MVSATQAFSCHRGSFIILHSQGESLDIYTKVYDELNAYGYKTIGLPYNKKIKVFCKTIKELSLPEPYYILGYGNSIARCAAIKQALSKQINAIILISPALRNTRLIAFGRRNILQKPNFLQGNSTPILIFTTNLMPETYLDSVVNLCNNYRMIYNIVLKGAKKHVLEDIPAYRNQFLAGLRAYLHVTRAPSDYRAKT